MQDSAEFIAGQIRSLRIAKGIKQSDLDHEAGLPRSSISKIEIGKREATACELMRIARALGVNLDTFMEGTGSFVYQEEIKIIESLREIPFDDYQRILHSIEAQIYYASKDAPSDRKRYLEDLVGSLTKLAQADRRPRSKFAQAKRVKRNE